jgi:predicted O-methyltransferase YrrM
MGEFASLLLMLKDERIRSVLEVGVFQGGTLAWFAAALPDASIVGIDPAPRLAPSIKPWAYSLVIRGCSQDPDMRQRARSLNDGEPFEFAFIDGDHTGPSVREDWEWAQREITRIVAFHDIAKVGNPSIEVKPLWEEIRESGRWRTAEVTLDDGPQHGIGVVWL